MCKNVIDILWEEKTCCCSDIQVNLPKDITAYFSSKVVACSITLNNRLKINCLLEIPR